jgi:hypothetical protein
MADLGYGLGLNAMETDFADYWDEIFERPFPVRPAINRDLRSELGLLRREICEGFGTVDFDIESPPMSGSMWPLHSIPAIPPLDTAREYEEDYLREQIAFCNEFLEDRKLDEVKRPAPAYYFRLVTFRNEQEIAEARFNLLHDLLQRQPSRRKAILMGTRYPEWFRAEVIKKGYAELPCIIDLLNHPPERGRDFAVNTFYPADYVQWLKDNRLYERPIIKPKLIEAAEIIDAMDYERGVTDVAPAPEVAEYVARISRNEKERYYDYREEVLAARDEKKK